MVLKSRQTRKDGASELALEKMRQGFGPWPLGSARVGCWGVCLCGCEFVRAPLFFFSERCVVCGVVCGDWCAPPTLAVSVRASSRAAGCATERYRTCVELIDGIPSCSCSSTVTKQFASVTKERITRLRLVGSRG